MTRQGVHRRRREPRRPGRHRHTPGPDRAQHVGGSGFNGPSHFTFTVRGARANAAPRPETSSPARKPGSQSSPATATPTPISRPSCTSALAPSITTCARQSLHQARHHDTPPPARRTRCTHLRRSALIWQSTPDLPRHSEREVRGVPRRWALPPTLTMEEPERTVLDRAVRGATGAVFGAAGARGSTSERRAGDSCASACATGPAVGDGPPTARGDATSRWRAGGRALRGGVGRLGDGGVRPCLVHLARARARWVLLGQ
jgi:hypothetical protein